MTRLVLIRHGPTAWNRDKRLQGRSDVPLSPAGRRWVASWRVPPEFRNLTLYASPLSRARETAEILFGTETTIRTDDRLREMSFGDWEGELLHELRARLGSEMAANEQRGFDFTPPGGESPRMVLTRMRPLLAEIAAAGMDCVAVCHLGLIRALHARAIGWNLVGKPPVKLLDGMAHILKLKPDGEPGGGVTVNLPLAPAPFDDAPSDA